MWRESKTVPERVHHDRGQTSGSCRATRVLNTPLPQQSGFPILYKTIVIDFTVT
ncbi:hypothetical protein SPHINGO391_440423 [Sphingomonas aurantiaca]|uniref:Uncharacterized protein n=1 Tax=Sphingomonas aurantiaca TaxID=185949 RepID=A0A5E7ZFJ4_9SPHN|nr:hypothetical protein SPHINGO391_440423 [Sphingomonas aurantiaca]